MNNEWKNFFKENILLILLFFVVIFGFLGLTIYNAIRDSRNSVIDYEGGILEEAPSVIRTYDENEYKIIIKDDQDLAEYYLKKLVKMWKNNPGELYDLMNDNLKNKYSSKEDAINKLNKLRSSQVLQSTIDSYKVEKGIVIILTNEGIEFKLSTNGINEFTIVYMGQI